ncbi:cell wall-binding repeat-containing protein [Candidatus Poriferisodalis sp.]|uniref:cell wall-binding repeat-containing protein n=1 Tax=Candidatus Poriferisodalis sp. TaxID=3101277 RepID=UPI003B01B884
MTVPAVHAAVAETRSERFGDRDRYATSVAIAEAYLDEIADDLDRAPTAAVIVVSGEDRHAAYAMPAAGLASAFDAPILLTRPGELHRDIAELFREHEFELALIVGGNEVVSAAVERELAALTDSVRRIGGTDPYSTSVAVAAEVGSIPGSAGEWGSRGRTALLANGETVADALVAGPLTYHGSHPLLLTPAAVLDARVSEYFDRSDVEHVVILGGVAAVSTAVESAVRDKGIGITRLAGDDHYGTAAVLARQLLGSGRPDPCFDGSVIGLAVGDRAPDAISSGPLLGERCAPLLLTRPRTVPAALDDVLTGGDLLGGSGRRLDVVVFGGTAAIADQTVSAVRNRAQRGEPFTAEVSATAGSTIFTVTFNEDVKEDEAVKPERYTVNNAALVEQPDDPAGQEPAAGERWYVKISLTGRTVSVELVEPLAVGNTITVVGETGTEEGRSQIAVDDTLPVLESVFYRVPRAAVVADSAGPAIQIVAIADEDEFVVLVTEPMLRNGDRLRNDVIYRGQPVPELTVVDSDGETKDVTFVDSEISCPHKPESGDPALDVGSDQIGEHCYEDPATLGANLRYTVTVPDGLEVGDVITVAKGALSDQRRNPNRLTRYTVTEHADNGLNGDFTVKRAAVGTPRHTKQASLLISHEGTDDEEREGRRRLRITAKSTGVAAGAAGNDWVVYPYVDPDVTDPAESVVEVGVDPVHRIISYTIVDGKITLANVAAALNANSTFRRHFSARVVSTAALKCRGAGEAADEEVDPVEIDDPAGGELCGGITTVGVRVQFTDHVNAVTDAAGFEPAPLFATLFLNGRNADDPELAVRCQRRGTVVYLEYVATDDVLVPRAGTPVRVPAGVAENYAGAMNLTQRRFNLRLDAEIPDQFGYEVEALTPQDGNHRADADGTQCDGDTP